MTLDYISDRIDRGQFLEKVYNASQSQSSKESAHTHLTNLDLYCKDKYGRDTETILDDLRTDMENTRSPSKVLRFLDDYVAWLQQDHPNILLTRARYNSAKYYLRKKNKNSISHYFSTARKYLSLVGGIRIHDDDIKMAITKPKADTGNYENEESEPLTAEQARAIIEITTDQQSITLYHFLNDTGFRMTETCLVQEKHINFEKNPVEIFLPKENSKGKNAGGTRYVRPETAKRLKLLCHGMPDHFVFKLYDSQKPIQFKHNHLQRIRKTYNALGMIDVYENSGRHKFNMHSWRKRCSTEYSRENGEALAHGYIRHRKSLAMYIVKTKEERISYFQRAMIDLAIDEIDKTKHNLEKKDKEILAIKKYNKELTRDAVLDVINHMSSKEIESLIRKK